MEANEIGVGYGELEFTGLKFSEDKSQYSWNGQKEYEKLCNELVEDGSNLSRIRYQNMINTQYKEEIHVNLSFSFLLKYLAYFLIGVSFLAIATQSLIFGSVVLILSVGSYLFHKYFLGKTKISYMGYKMAPEFLKLLFA